MLLSKTVRRGGKDRDQHLPYVLLFAYRASQQQSTLELPFYFRLPTESVMCPKRGMSSGAMFSRLSFLSQDTVTFPG